jgi:uroporphyrinogen-III synthase
MPANNLSGVCVAVTRPAHQAAPLCQLIERLGGAARRFPVLEIVPTLTPEFFQTVERLKDYQLAIFISVNAVNIALDAIEQRGGLPATLKVAAVGKATAEALSRHGHPPDISPQDRYDSEALLATPRMRSLQGQKVVIFRGRGGRELLAQSLRERGAQVSYAECYVRQRPAAGQPLFGAETQCDPDIIVVTSNEGLDNLCHMAGVTGRDRLLSTPIVVVSVRMRDHAQQLGFSSDIVVAERASDPAIMQALSQWRR